METNWIWLVGEATVVIVIVVIVVAVVKVT